MHCLTKRLFYFVVIAFLSIPEDACAALLFCNHTKVPIETAVGYREDGEWYSEGWWQIKPGLCIRTYNDPLSQRFYFYYARSLSPLNEAKEPTLWQGKYAFCIKDSAFYIKGDGGCEKRGLKTQGFHEIDINGKTKDYTLNFRDK